MKFLYFKSKNSINEIMPFIVQAIEGIIEINKYHVSDSSLIIFFNYEKEEIKNYLLSLTEELVGELLIYESNEYNSEKYFNEAITIFEQMLTKYHLKYQYYNNKILLSENYKDDNVVKLILNKYYNDAEMKKTIIGFLENNQNATKAAKKLFLHRNSLNMRITKFKEATNFDLKTFKDAYLIYKLLK